MLIDQKKYSDDFRSFGDFYQFVFDDQIPSNSDDLHVQFINFSRRLTIRTTQAAAVVFAAIFVLFWPADFFTFRYDPEVLRQFTNLRISCIALMTAGLVVTEIILRRTLAFYWVGIVIFGAAICVIPFLTLGDYLGDPQQPFFYAVYLTPALTLFFVIPLLVRVVAAVAFPLSWLVAHAILYPQYVVWPLHGAIVALVVFVAICSVLMGHGLYRLISSNFLREWEVRNERERVADLNRQLSRLFANVSHELRTPLTVIQGNLRRLGERLADDEQMTRWVRGLDRNTARLSILVDQFLAMSRNDEAISSVHVQSIAVREFIESIIEAIYAGCDEDSRPVVIPESEELICQADPSQLADILYNLISNARKFSEAERGEHAKVQVIVSRVDDSIAIRVKDNGPGIPEVQLDHVFNRFHQAHDENSLRRGGVGLGLAIVDELVRANKGSIEVASVVDAGTEFVLRLPASRHATQTTTSSVNSEHTASVHTDSTGALTHGPSHVEGETIGSLMDSSVGSRKLDRFRSANRRRQSSVGDIDGSHSAGTALKRSGQPSIMIIDDEPDMLEHLMEALERMPLNLHAFSRADRALDMIDDVAPDLVITDLMMPHIDGGSMIDRLLDRPEYRRIPIIVISADHAIGTRVDMLERGAVDFMTKPFQADELIARVHRHLAVAQWTSQLDQATGELTRVSQKLQQVEQLGDHIQFGEQVAHVLHNDFGQLIAACRVEVEIAEDASDMPQAYESIGRLREALAMLTVTFRDTLSSLTQGRARELSVDELKSSIEALPDRLTIAIDEDVYAKLRELPASVGHPLTRALQECITNTLKHASATRAWVNCDVGTDFVRLTVNDNGKGFNFTESGDVGAGADSRPDNLSGLNVTDGYHMGIRGIRSQVESLGGTIVISDNEFGGASVVVECPVRRDTAARQERPT